MTSEPEVTAIGRLRGLAAAAVAAVAVLLVSFPVALAAGWLPAPGRLVPVLGAMVAAIGVVKVVAALVGAVAGLRTRPPSVTASIE